MIAEKITFLKNDLLKALRSVPSDTPPRWGKRTLQQMVEHFSESVRIASGKMEFSNLLTPEENLPKMRAFMMSDKPFRENTANPLLPEIPAPVYNASIEKALEELQEEISGFFQHFESHPGTTTRNPFFGDLNFEQNVHLLYKHALHHLKQFGVQP